MPSTSSVIAIAKTPSLNASSRSTPRRPSRSPSSRHRQVDRRDRGRDRRRLVLLQEVLGRDQLGLIDAEHVAGDPAVAQAERRVVLAPEDGRRVGVLLEPIPEEVLLLPGQLEAAHDLQEGGAADRRA